MGSMLPLLAGLPENYVETLRDTLLHGNLAAAQTLVLEFEAKLQGRIGVVNKADFYSTLRDEVLRDFSATQRPLFEAFLLEAGAL